MNIDSAIVGIILDEDLQCMSWILGLWPHMPTDLIEDYQDFLLEGKIWTNTEAIKELMSDLFEAYEDERMNKSMP